MVKHVQNHMMLHLIKCFFKNQALVEQSPFLMYDRYTKTEKPRQYNLEWYAPL